MPVSWRAPGKGTDGGANRIDNDDTFHNDNLNRMIEVLTHPVANADYQVIIPAAGCSRRLAHRTAERPKSLLSVGAKTIIHHALDALADLSFTHVTFVVGYQRELFMQTLGASHRQLTLEYVVSEDYSETEHGWSLYLSAESWAAKKQPVLFMDADNLYDPALLELVLAHDSPDVCLVDERIQPQQQEEELILGRDGHISGLKRGLATDWPDVVGGFVGINRFSADFMGRLFTYMGPFFASHGRQQKYERVFDHFIQHTDTTLGYGCIGALEWLNINYEFDYEQAQRLAVRLSHATSFQ